MSINGASERMDSGGEVPPGKIMPGKPHRKLPGAFLPRGFFAVPQGTSAH